MQTASSECLRITWSLFSMKLSLSLAGQETAYKIMTITDGIVRSINSGKAIGRLQAGLVIDEPVYMCKSKKFALQYYTNDTGNEVLLTLQYAGNDVLGDYRIGDPVVTAKKAKILAFDIL